MSTNTRPVQNRARRPGSILRPSQGAPIYSLGAMLLFVAAFLGPLGTATPAGADCELAFDPPSVEVGNDEVEVTATPSQETGTPNGIVVDDASGLHITLSEEDPFQLVVDATAAEAGEWMVTLMRDETPLCHGPIGVITPNH